MLAMFIILKTFLIFAVYLSSRLGLHFIANGTETLAIPQPDGSYKLHGYKWFSSATDADMTFTLARVIGHDGTIIQVISFYWSPILT